MYEIIIKWLGSTHYECSLLKQRKCLCIHVLFPTSSYFHGRNMIEHSCNVLFIWVWYPPQWKVLLFNLIYFHILILQFFIMFRKKSILKMFVTCRNEVFFAKCNGPAWRCWVPLLGILVIQWWDMHVLTQPWTLLGLDSAMYLLSLMLHCHLQPLGKDSQGINALRNPYNTHWRLMTPHFPICIFTHCSTIFFHKSSLKVIFSHLYPYWIYKPGQQVFLYKMWL